MGSQRLTPLVITDWAETALINDVAEVSLGSETPFRTPIDAPASQFRDPARSRVAAQSAGRHGGYSVAQLGADSP